MNKKIRFIKDNLFELLLSIPKSIYFNFRVLPFEYAIHFPYVISHNIKLKGVNKHSFIVENPNMKFASQRIGFDGSWVGYGERRKGLIYIRNGGKVVVNGSIGLSKGIVIDNDGGIINLGKNFRCNYSGTISCEHAKILIGDDVVCGWKVTIKNGDGHTVIEDGKDKHKFKDITIGKHVWLCSYSTVMKGTYIGDNCVLAYKSVLLSCHKGNNLLYAGYPAKILRDNINWRE